MKDSKKFQLSNLDKLSRYVINAAVTSSAILLGCCIFKLITNDYLISPQFNLVLTAVTASLFALPILANILEIPRYYIEKAIKNINNHEGNTQIQR